MSQTVELWKEIQTPDAEFTPIPFWFFNDFPDKKKIRTQLEDYVEKGVQGFVLHPRIGVPKEIGYLTERYFAAVRYIVQTAHELDMKVVLYDEGMYPSGSAKGAVVKNHPEYASVGIRLVKEEDAKGEIITHFDDGMCLDFTFTGGTIRGIHFGEDDGEAGAPPSADILNPDAVDEFIHLTHDRYYKELSEYFGTTIIAFFTDEPSAIGRNAEQYREWYPGLDKELLAAGASLTELRDLFEKKTNSSVELYHKLIKKRLREVFYFKLSDWCEKHGIALMGHPENSDDVEEELYFHIPGQDLIMRRVSPETGGITEFDSVQAKLSSDIARHLGRRRNANECFGVCVRDHIPWYLPACDMKWYIDWLGIRGVNLFVPHAFYYSVEGARKEERPPDVGPNNIWWAHYRQISTYMKRLSYLMTDSANGARVAVLCHNNQVPYAEIKDLFTHQVEFNYLPIDLLPQCEKKDGKLCIREYAYDAVLNMGSPAWEQGLDGISVYHTVKEILEIPSVCNVMSYGMESLRTTALRKHGVQMYLFSNEGCTLLKGKVTLQGEKLAEASDYVWMDLWRNEERKTCVISRSENAVTLSFELKPLETRLLICDAEGDLTGLLSEKPEFTVGKLSLGDATKSFSLVEKKANKAVYRMELDLEKVTGLETITVSGTEMMECYVNGQFADVALWTPYELSIGKQCKVGKNEIELIVTGNAANVYCGSDIDYGLIME